MIKFTYLVNRVEGMTFEEFAAYHRDHHAPLFASIPEARHYVRKYAVSHPVAAPGYPGPACDGLTEIWFASWEDHDAFFASENYRTLVNPDEGRFIDLGSVRTVVAEEKVVI